MPNYCIVTTLCIEHKLSTSMCYVICNVWQIRPNILVTYKPYGDVFLIPIQGYSGSETLLQQNCPRLNYGRGVPTDIGWGCIIAIKLLYNHSVPTWWSTVLVRLAPPAEYNLNSGVMPWVLPVKKDLTLRAKSRLIFLPPHKKLRGFPQN